MTSAPEWLGMVLGARRLGVSVRELYDAVDQGQIDARWVRDPLLRIEVAVDDGPMNQLTARAG